MQHEVSGEGTLASRGVVGAAAQGRVIQDAGSRRDDSFSTEETWSPSQLAQESCRGWAGPGVVQASPGVPAETGWCKAQAGDRDSAPGGHVGAERRARLASQGWGLGEGTPALPTASHFQKSRPAGYCTALGSGST